MKFIHTADWQLGKPFAGIQDDEKRSQLRRERIEAVKRIGELARAHGADFVLVAGDLFDSASASRSVVSAACSAIGAMKVPVVAIPGNHDHGGPGSVWEQEFFRREQASLAPNLRVALAAEPIVLDSAVIFPCPLLRRRESTDTTAWLRDGSAFATAAPDRPRIVLAHGSTQSFGGQGDDSEEDSSATNMIALGRLPTAEIDYVALGDWHGAKAVDAKAWYSGTPELDRFPKGSDHQQGYVLLVEVERGGQPKVEKLATGHLQWHQESFDFADDTGLETLKGRIQQIIGDRTGEDLLELHLSGSLGITAANELQQLIQTLEARILRLKLDDRTTIAPTDEEIAALTSRAGDPLISSVAIKLVNRTQHPGEEAELARIALRELHAAVSATHS